MARQQKQATHPEHFINALKAFNRLSKLVNDTKIKDALLFCYYVSCKVNLAVYQCVACIQY